MRVQTLPDFRNRIPDDSTHPGISYPQAYYVLGVTEGFYRLIDDLGDPYLYPKQLFEVVDRSVPSGWEFREAADGEYFLEPALTARPGFYEDFFGSDGDRAAQLRARAAVKVVLEQAVREIGDADLVLRSAMASLLDRHPSVE
jgi:hypothetical protein